MEIIILMVLLGFIIHEEPVARGPRGHFHTNSTGHTVYSNYPSNKCKICQAKRLALENYDRFDVLM